MKSFSILGGKAHMVVLPDGGSDPKIVDGMLYYRDYIGTDGIQLPPGTWQIVGMLSEVTDKTLSTVLDSTELNEGIRLYNIHGEPYPNRLTDSALESLESAILAEGYYLDNNPVPPFNERLNDWIEAQSRVLDRSRCLLLGRED